jgi:myotubularin-related protein 5/13
LGAKGVCSLLAAALQESRILLHSRCLALLAVVAEGVFALMYPLQWAYAYVPVLPRVLIELIESPQPFLLGVHTVSTQS